GLATDPTKNELFSVLRIHPSDTTVRLLATVDPTSGVATEIGNPGLAIATIAIAADGTLYAVTGDGAVPPHTLFSIDKTTANPTQLLALTDNGQGEAIAFNSDD
ncbi:MAG: hypothetical protein GTO41_08445, partial [Burkholderiales bacterium]|nr:hypothetical protein [Burkholderiales bacterium]